MTAAASVWQAVNGQDVAANPDHTSCCQTATRDRSSSLRPWYAVDVFNNMIVNNVAALAGGGISLRDAVDVHLVHNTIANNDSLATAGEAFAPGSPNESNAAAREPASPTRAHSPQLTAAGNIVCSAPAGSAGNACSVDADCDSVPSAGDGVCDNFSDPERLCRQHHLAEPSVLLLRGSTRADVHRVIRACTVDLRALPGRHGLGLACPGRQCGGLR